MSDKQDLKNRADKMSGGDEIGGTTFGQSPGEADDQKQRRSDEADASDAKDDAGKVGESHGQ